MLPYLKISRVLQYSFLFCKCIEGPACFEDRRSEVVTEKQEGPFLQKSEILKQALTGKRGYRDLKGNY